MNLNFTEQPVTNITEEHKADFNALVSREHGNFALFSCFVNGEPTAAIVAVEYGEDTAKVSPLFVAITPGMVLTDHNGRETEKAGQPEHYYSEAAH